MLLATIICLFATAAARPTAVVYDQRQDGKNNIDSKLSNMFFLLAVPAEKPPIYDVFNALFTGIRMSLEAHGGNVTVIGSYPETRKSERIGSDESNVLAEGSVIPGRRRFDPVDALQNGLNVENVAEKCGPDLVRDSVTGVCKDMQPVKIISETELQKQTDLKGVLLKLQPVPDAIPS